MTQTAAATSEGLEGSRETRDKELFDRIALKYCKKDVWPSSGLARAHRSRRTIRVIPRTARGSMLDVGCGGGFAARQLAAQYKSFVGIDYSDNLIAFAQEHNASEKARFEVADLLTYEPVEQFDVVLMIGVLHHIPKQQEAVDRMVELVKPGGWVVENEPQPGNPLFSYARRVRAKMDGSYSEEQDELSGKQIRAQYEKAGLGEIVVRAQGIFSTPFAEVPVGPAFLTSALSRLASTADTAVETLLGPVPRRLSWNVIVAGRKAEQA
eukprot:TRINITY_DN9036_c0_g1_i4.p1 TRINITY_DN9036_c0_g1~~TRINITY_DN9036_c0_g1_i4.p1  ORF type:complete len:267 (-),score=38.51 TRINITY_DN9036_c0_g1_i4:258-1058(-)